MADTLVASGKEEANGALSILLVTKLLGHLTYFPHDRTQSHADRHTSAFVWYQVRAGIWRKHTAHARLD